MVETKEENFSFKLFNLKRETGFPGLEDASLTVLKLKTYNLRGYELT